MLLLWRLQCVVSRLVNQKAVAAWVPGFTAQCFECRSATATAIWQRPAGHEFVVAWVQPTRSPDPLGWYGSRFIIEFRRGAQPRSGVMGPGFRFCQLLDDEGREQVRVVNNAVIRRLPPAPARVLRIPDDRTRDWYLAQGRQVTAAYGPDPDILFRHREGQHPD